MKVIKPIEFTVDASTIDIDSDGYEEWENDFKTPNYLFVGFLQTGGRICYSFNEVTGALTKVDALSAISGASIGPTSHVFSADRQYLAFTYGSGGFTPSSRLHVWLNEQESYSPLSVDQTDLGNFSAVFYQDHLIILSSNDFLSVNSYLFVYKIKDSSVNFIFKKRFQGGATGLYSDNRNLYLVSGQYGYQGIRTLIFDERKTDFIDMDFVKFDDPIDTNTYSTMTDDNFVITFIDNKLYIINKNNMEDIVQTINIPNLRFARLSNSENFIAATCSSAPYLRLYKNNGNLFESHALATDINSSGGFPDWSQDDEFLFVPHLSSPYISIYKMDSSGDFIKQSDPSDLPGGSSTRATFFPGVSYGQGNIIRRGNDLYESLINDNQSNDPAIEISTSPTWLHLGKVNKHRMFDDKLSTLSVQPGTTGQSFTLSLDSATEGFFELISFGEYVFSGTSVNRHLYIKRFSFPYNVTATTIQSTLEDFFGTGLVTVTAATDFTIAFDPIVGDSRLRLGSYSMGTATPTLTQTVAYVAASLIVTLTPLEAGSDHVYLFGLDATAVTVEHYESNGTTLVSTSGAVDVTGKKSIGIELTRQMTADEKVKITIANTADTAKCGKVVIGEARITEAKTQWGIEAGIKSYGRRNFDDFGQAFLKRGNVAKKIKASCILNSNAEVDEIYEVLSDLDNTPVVWDFNEQYTHYSTLQAYGIYLDARVPFQGLNHIKMQLDILGLI